MLALKEKKRKLVFTDKWSPFITVNARGAFCNLGNETGASGRVEDGILVVGIRKLARFEKRENDIILSQNIFFLRRKGHVSKQILDFYIKL